jgi:hypothetical protein
MTVDHAHAHTTEPLHGCIPHLQIAHAMSACTTPMHAAVPLLVSLLSGPNYRLNELLELHQVFCSAALSWPLGHLACCKAKVVTANCERMSAWRRRADLALDHHNHAAQLKFILHASPRPSVDQRLVDSV